MVVSNCLIRMGGAAILLSNKRTNRNRSKHQLIHSVQIHKGKNDSCHNWSPRKMSFGRLEFLSKDLMGIGDALKTNITTLVPLVLSMFKQLLFFAILVGRLLELKIKPNITDFKLAFEYFNIHVGGREVLDELEKNLQETDKKGCRGEHQLTKRRKEKAGANSFFRNALNMGYGEH
ncbi:3-ketoacyl-CoA synthase 11 [Platanthera guangdongensis]|uniref:3-ketoacyl-CoA synthase 11 n=1 Tax=Platanthera guangdongensis TaxID=2320717 RepID=A0ABR2MJW4_9ASPA